MIYFAYGSNMFTYRLEKRIGKVRVIGIGKLDKYIFEFSKESKDGSLKANIYDTGKAEDITWGVLFEIDADRKSDLDKYEGVGSGYDIREVIVEQSTGQKTAAFTYTAPNRHFGNRNFPYEWYRALVIAGAKEHVLPDTYILYLETFAFKADPDQIRKETFYRLDKESKFIRKYFTQCFALMDRLNSEGDYNIELTGHALDNRRIIISKNKNEFSFETEIAIPKGRETHRELNVQGKTILLKDAYSEWLIDGKDFITNNFAYDFDNHLKIIKGSVTAIGTTTEASFNGSGLRLMVPVDEVPRILSDYECVPFTIDYKERYDLMNLTIGGNEFHFFSVQHGDRKFAVIDCLASISMHVFQISCNAILMTYAFLSGKYHSGQGYFFAFGSDTMEVPSQVLFHTLGEIQNDLYPVFTTNAYFGVNLEILRKGDSDDKIEDERQQRYSDLRYFPRKVFSNICEMAINDDKLLRTLTLLMNSQVDTVEIKIPLQYITIETITAAITSGNKELKPVENDEYSFELIELLTKTAKAYLMEKGIIDAERLNPLFKNIGSINNPPNADKLGKSFAMVNYTLLPEERKFLNLRNKFLHGSSITAGTNSTEDIERDFKTLFYLSLRLHFLIAVLVLKNAGFSGRIINYAKMYEYITQKYSEEDILRTI